MLRMYKDWLKIISRKPLNIFWILFFPIILVTLFKMTMGNNDLVTSFSEKIKIEFIKTNNEELDSQIEKAFNSEELKNYCDFKISDNIEISQNRIEKVEIDG